MAVTYAKQLRNIDQPLGEHAVLRGLQQIFAEPRFKRAQYDFVVLATLSCSLIRESFRRALAQTQVR
jgi:hypothetical protein